MIAKIVKGSSFRGVVNYILDKEKDAKILVCDGLFSEDKDTIVMSFEAQAGMNPRVMKPVGPYRTGILQGGRAPSYRPDNGRNCIGILGENGYKGHTGSCRAPL